MTAPEDTAATNERETLAAKSCPKHGGLLMLDCAECTCLAVHVDSQREAVAEAIHRVWMPRVPWYAEGEHLKAWFRTVADAALAATQRPDDREATLRARIGGVLAEHWDWKAGRSLHAAITAALAAADGSPS